MAQIIDWFAERAATRKSTFVAKSGRDKGFILVTTMVLFAGISASVVGVLGAAQSTVVNTTLSREFIQSGQIADAAIQDAMYQLNQAPTAPLPTSAAPRTGNRNGGTWEWFATNTGTARTGPQLSISATGAFAKTTRNVTATAAALTVGSFTTNADGQLSYEVSPRSAFQHVLFGKNVTAQNGPGIGAATTWLAGAVGATTTSVNVADQPSYPSNTDAQFSLYGSLAAGAAVTDARRAPVSLQLDSKFVDDNTSRCGGAGAEAWVASANGGRLVANDNTGCYSSMNFDVPTVIEGTKAFNAFVAGNVNFRDNVSVPSTAALNIYTNGHVTFYPDQSAATSLNISNTFIYAANGACKTSPFDTAIKALFFTGSLACDIIKVDGKFTTKPSINPLGDEVFSSSIWYLTDYRQPSGSRG